MCSFPSDTSKMFAIKIIKHWQFFIVVALALYLNTAVANNTKATGNSDRTAEPAPLGLLLLTKEYGTSISSKSELKDQRNSQSFHHNQDNIQRKNENRKVVLVADVNEAKRHIKTSMELGLVSKEGQSITFSPMGIRERYLKRSIATERGQSPSVHELVTEGAFVYPVKTKDRPLSRTPREVNSEKNGEKRRHADPPIATPFQEVPKKRGGMFVIVSEDNIVEKEIDFPNAEAPIKGRTSASDFVANADIRRALMPTTVASGIIRNSDASQTNDKKSQEIVQSVLTLAPEDSVSVLATDTILAEKWSVGTAETTAAYKQDLQGNNNSTRFINPNQNKYNTYNQSVQGLRDKNDQLAEKNILNQQLKNVHKTKYSGKFTIVSQALIPDVSPPNESKTGLINYSLLMDDQPKELSNWNETNYLIFTATPQHHKVNHEQELTDVNMGKDLQSQDMDKKPIGFKTKSSEESVRTATQKGQDNDLSTDVRNNDTVYAPKIEISSKLASNLNKSSLSEKLQDGRSLVPNAAENKDLRIRSNFEPYPGTTFENSIAGRTSNPTMKKYTLDPNPTLVSQMFKRTTKEGEKEIQQIKDLEHDQSETDNYVIKSANSAENEIKPTSPNLPRKEQRSGSDSDSLDDKPSLYQHNLQETTTTVSLTKDRKPVSDYLPSIDRINKSAQESKSANFHDVKPPNLVQSEISSARKLLGADLENEAPIAGELLEESSQQQEFLKAKVLDDALNVSTTYSSKTSGHYSNGSDIKMSKVLTNTSLGVHAGIEGNSPQSLVDGVETTSYIHTGFQEGFLSESSFQQQQETENSYLDPIHQKFDKPSAQEDTLNNLQSGYLSEQYLQGFYGGEKLDAPKMYDLLASHSSDDNKPKKSPLANARDSSFLLDRLHESLQYDGNALELSFNRQNPGTLNKHKMTHDSLQSRDDFGEAPGSLESTLEDNDNPHTQVKSAADKAIMMHKKKMAEELGNAFAVESEPDYVPGDVREATEGKSNVIPVAESIAEAPKKRYFSNRKNGGDISRMQNSAATTPKDVRSVKRAEFLQQKSKHLPASWTKAAILQSNLPPFFWSTDTARDVLPADYFSDASNDKSWIKSKRKYLIKPLPLNMQAALLPMTNRKLGIIPTCMMMVAFFIFLLGIGVTAIVFAQKRRFKKYTRRFVYTMILASRLREESLRKRKNKAQEVHINLETNLCPYVTLQRKYLSDEVYQNLRNAIKKVSEYQSMIDVYEKIKKTGDRQKLDTVAALLADFFRKERDESAQKAKMIKLIAEAQTN